MTPGAIIVPHCSIVGRSFRAMTAMANDVMICCVVSWLARKAYAEITSMANDVMMLDAIISLRCAAR